MKMRFSDHNFPMKGRSEYALCNESKNYATNCFKIRRTGSAAPHNNWSPTVNAAKYSGPIANLRKRPTGTLNVPCYFSWG